MCHKATYFVQTRVRAATTYPPSLPSTGAWAWGSSPASCRVKPGSTAASLQLRGQVYRHHIQLGGCGPAAAMLDWGAAPWGSTSPSEAPGALRLRSSHSRAPATAQRDRLKRATPARHLAAWRSVLTVNLLSMKGSSQRQPLNMIHLVVWLLHHPGNRPIPGIRPSGAPAKNRPRRCTLESRDFGPPISRQSRDLGPRGVSSNPFPF